MALALDNERARIDALDSQVQSLRLDYLGLVRRMDIRDLIQLGVALATFVLAVTTFVLVLVLLTRPAPSAVAPAPAGLAAPRAALVPGAVPLTLEASHA